MAKKVSLAELMGSKGASSSGSLSLDQLPDILGESMPELPRNNVGRFRLVRALQQRFGKNFRSLPGVSNLIKEFDSDMEFEDKISRMKKIKIKRSK